MKKDKMIQLRISSKHDELLQQIAEDNGMTKSEYIRTVCLIEVVDAEIKTELSHYFDDMEKSIKIPDIQWLLELAEYLYRIKGIIDQINHKTDDLGRTLYAILGVIEELNISDVAFNDQASDKLLQNLNDLRQLWDDDIFI